MYLSKSVIINSGPISNLQLVAPFSEAGLPKPLVVVGANGSGKTGLLSTIADAVAEIAAQHFVDVLPQQGPGHQYFRIVGGRNLRTGQLFEFAALRFTHQNADYFVRVKAGKISPETLSDALAGFGPIKNFPEQGNDKTVIGNNDLVAQIFSSGAYAFFPSSRYELPHWANRAILERDPAIDFAPQFADRLDKPIIIQSAVQALKPWLVDVILDRSIDFALVLGALSLDILKWQLTQSHPFLLQNYANLNAIISTILGRDARLVRVTGATRDRRISIAVGNDVIVPSLDHLSAGQSTLLAIFGTIARYGGAPRLALDQIEGIVIVDEIDAHLHADLQHETLPALIKLFPRVQFILSSHAPLFLLGMKKVFGPEGFMLLDMPSGFTIDAERYTDFERSFSYFRATQAFERTVQAKFTAAQKPLVLTEGETDPNYLKAAADLLGFSELLSEAEFDWVGIPEVGGAQGGGKSHLDDALKFLKNNPQFQTRRIVLLYDPETAKPEQDFGTIHVRRLTRIVDARRQSGIENLLPDHVYEPRFFENRTMGKGDDKGPVPVLNKKSLCAFLCDEKRNPADFESFRSILVVLTDLLLSREQA
jgi:hypothetical protein